MPQPDTAAQTPREAGRCPFCRVKPTVEHKRAGWRIACHNDDCPTMPNGFFYAERDEAIEAWNTPGLVALDALIAWRKADLQAGATDCQLTAANRAGRPEARSLAKASFEDFLRSENLLDAVRVAADRLMEEG